MTDSSHHTNIETYRNAVSEMLDAHETILLTGGGHSMFPVLRPHDVLCIEKVDSHMILRGDIIVFSLPKKTVGHRVISVKKSSQGLVFTTQGDNCLRKDNPIFTQQIVGRVTGFIRNERSYSLQSMRYRFIRFLLLYVGFFSRLYIHTLFRINRVFYGMKNTLKTWFEQCSLILSGARKPFIISGFFSVLQAIIPFVIIFCITRLVDALSGSSHNQSEHFIYILVGITACAFLVNRIALTYGTVSKDRLFHAISLRIHTLLHKKTVDIAYSYMEDSQKQDLLHRAVTEASTRPQRIIQNLFVLIRSTISLLVVGIFMFQVHWVIILVLLVGLFPTLYVRLRMAKQLHELRQKQSQGERKAFYVHRILTALPFAKELRLFSTANYFSGMYTAEQTSLHTGRIAVARTHARADVLTYVFAVVVLAVSFVYVTYLALHGSISVGTVVLFILVIQRGFTTLNDMFQSLAYMYQDSVFFADFMSFLSVPIHKPTTTKENTLPSLHVGIRFSNLSFQYPSSTRTAIQHINMFIPAQKTVAIVGANGSGKTTLVKLLCGLYQPTQGLISYDSIQLTAEHQHEIRSKISAVFQDFALYNLPLSTNISLGNIGEANDEEKLKHALSVAGLLDDVQSLPEGYHTILGNYFAKGEELSIGQWQKIAIARAVYRDAEIVVLDEPSSALDPESEQDIVSRLQTLAKDKTVLIISHRFSTIQWADCIYVMKQGNVIESGTHAELMDTKGEYYRMYSAQRS